MPTEQHLERLDGLISEIQDRFFQLISAATIGRTRLVPKEDLFDLEADAGVNGSGEGFRRQTMEEAPEDIAAADTLEIQQLAELQQFQSAYHTSAFVQSCEHLLQLINDQKVGVALSQQQEAAAAPGRPRGGERLPAAPPLHARLLHCADTNRAALESLSAKIETSVAEIEDFFCESTLAPR